VAKFRGRDGDAESGGTWDAQGAQPLLGNGNEMIHFSAFSYSVEQSLSL